MVDASRSKMEGLVQALGADDLRALAQHLAIAVAVPAVRGRARAPVAPGPPAPVQRTAERSARASVQPETAACGAAGGGTR